MAKRQLHLSETEVGQFQAREQQTRDVHELKRLQAVRLYGTGMALQTIMVLTGSGESSVRQWAMKYGSGGLAALQSQWRGENANKLNAEQRAELVSKLEQYTPDQMLPSSVRIERGQFWTLSDLEFVVAQWYGVHYQSQTSYRTLLHECGLSYQKVERVYRSQPSAEQVAEFEADLEKK